MKITREVRFSCSTSAKISSNIQPFVPAMTSFASVRCRAAKARIRSGRFFRGSSVPTYRTKGVSIPRRERQPASSVGRKASSAASGITWIFSRPTPVVRTISLAVNSASVTKASAFRTAWRSAQRDMRRVRRLWKEGKVRNVRSWRVKSRGARERGTASRLGTWIRSAWAAMSFQGPASPAIQRRYCACREIPPPMLSASG